MDSYIEGTSPGGGSCSGEEHCSRVRHRFQDAQCYNWSNGKGRSALPKRKSRSQFRLCPARSRRVAFTVKALLYFKSA